MDNQVMKQYRATQDFISPDLGNVSAGQKLEISEQRATNWLSVGLIEPVIETKPEPSDSDLETKPEPELKTEVKEDASSRRSRHSKGSSKS